MVAVGLIERVAEESKAQPIAGNDGARMRGLGRLARAGRGNAMTGEPLEREFDTVAVAVAGVVVRGGYDVDAGQLEREDHLGLGFEDHPLLDGTAAVGERRFQIHERNIGRCKKRREVAQRRCRVMTLPRETSDKTRKHYVAAEQQPRFLRARDNLRRIRPAKSNERASKRRRVRPRQHPEQLAAHLPNPERQ